MNVPHDPYRRPGVHYPEELGAQVLGLLDPVQNHAIQEHLAGCPACRREWEELRGMVTLLDDVVPPEAGLEGPPDADFMLRRTLRQVRKEAGAQRRRRWITGAGAAAVTLGVVLAGGVVLGRDAAPPPDVVAAPAPAPGAVVLTGGGEPGVSMTTTLTPAAGWVRLTTSVQGIPEGERCYIVVVARDGTRQIAGSWVVGPSGRPIDGSALVPLDDVDQVIVENEQGREFAVAQT
jgi:Putative zinc-finger